MCFVMRCDTYTVVPPSSECLMGETPDQPCKTLLLDVSRLLPAEFSFFTPPDTSAQQGFSQKSISARHVWPGAAALMLNAKCWTHLLIDWWWTVRSIILFAYKPSRVTLAYHAFSVVSQKSCKMHTQQKHNLGFRESDKLLTLSMFFIQTSNYDNGKWHNFAGNCSFSSQRLLTASGFYV